jgi:hypothetical protein
MIGRIKRLFSLEGNLQRLLNSASVRVEKELDQVKTQLRNNEKVMERIRSDFNERLTRIEVLFADELKDKEQARDALIRERNKQRFTNGSD